MPPATYVVGRATLGVLREEMVLGETKAGLRSAVADGLLEYRRTCDTADADRVQVNTNRKRGIFAPRGTGIINPLR